ncbi:MAG: rRNA cytosine-C5-methyltransferase [Muribaculaceae bacterium]|nr:rRNA cytosine-C5-methyltransferase [Muribaculaceae bacterium]
MKLPEEFIAEIESYGAACLAGVADALASTEPEVSVRVNEAKGAKVPKDAEKVAWCETGFYLSERPQFTFDPALHQGLYYVQDASSMAIAQAIAHIAEAAGNQAMKYLDACAAPGGKTTAAIASLPSGSVVVANEYDYRRAAILAENLAKWGAPSVIVSRGDTARFTNLRNCFDIIAADVPCSGEGMMRKDDEAVAQWSQALVAECAARQREIVNNLWEALRPGGWMIYSTCTFNRHENEEMVDYICDELGGETIDIGLNGVAGVASAVNSDRYCYRFVPGRVRGEGLFMSVIRKNGNQSANEPKMAKKPLTLIGKAPGDGLKAMEWLQGDYELATLGESVIAIPKDNAKWMRATASWLDVVSIGVNVATVKGRDVIPSQELALSTALNRNEFQSVELDYPTAISYLRHEAISIEAPRGFVLLTYGSIPLGFVKNLGNRANNLYPSAWRIMSQNTPAIAPKIL